MTSLKRIQQNKQNNFDLNREGTTCFYDWLKCFSTVGEEGCKAFSPVTLLLTHFFWLYQDLSFIRVRVTLLTGPWVQPVKMLAFSWTDRLRCQFHQPICGMRKGNGRKEMVQKMMLCFTNINAEILLYILSYCFCTEHHILAHFFKFAIDVKHIKSYLRKSCSALVPEMLIKLTKG